MNSTHDNILSRIEREYVSFLYDNARRTTTQTVTISQIQEFIKTEEGQKGLESFKLMRAKRSVPTVKQPMPVGAFL
jgi:hypothetical protein